MISRYISPMTIHHEGTTSRDRVKSNLLHRRDDATCIPVSFTYRDSRAKFSQTSPGVPFQYLSSNDMASRPSGSGSPPLCYTSFYYLLSISCRLLSPSPLVPLVHLAHHLGIQHGSAITHSFIYSFSVKTITN